MIDDDPKVNGNLTGSAVTMNTAISRVARFAGLPVEEAVRWGSINPAVTVGIEHETGSLQSGKAADITVFDDEFTVFLTVVRGNVVYDGGE